MIGQTLSGEGGRRAGWALGLAIAVGIVGWLGVRTLQQRPFDSAADARVRVDLLEPRGVIDRAPARFEWRPVTNATRYDVRIADDDALWPLFVRSTASAMLLLDPNETRALTPGRIHVWEVDAKDAAGFTIASGSAQFKVGASTGTTR